jgi:hypothetical protein
MVLFEYYLNLETFFNINTMLTVLLIIKKLKCKFVADQYSDWDTGQMTMELWFSCKQQKGNLSKHSDWHWGALSFVFGE